MEVTTQFDLIIMEEIWILDTTVEKSKVHRYLIEVKKN